jgi:DNA-binding protein YbaB
MERDKGILEGEISGLERRMHQAQEEIATLAIEAKSKDGLIEMIVGSQGRLRELRLDPRVKRLAVEDLSERLVEMMNDALDLLQQETATKISATFPDFPASDFFGGPAQ